MKISRHRFNIYLLVTLATVAVCGCRSTGDKQSKKLLSTLRLHWETTRNGSKSSERVPIYRAQPVWLTVEEAPFLTEANVEAAKVVEGEGGFELHIQFDDTGTALLEAATVENHGKRMAIFSQFGDKIDEHRWLAAPVISHRISDGVLVFTPDTSREEAEVIAQGLNNVAKKVRTWVDR
jgi:preprotein translocase subunit SecD